MLLLVPSTLHIFCPGTSAGDTNIPGLGFEFGVGSLFFVYGVAVGFKRICLRARGLCVYALWLRRRGQPLQTPALAALYSEAGEHDRLSWRRCRRAGLVWS